MNDKKMAIKAGMIGLVANPTKKEAYHNYGWTKIYKNMLGHSGRSVDILTEEDDWSQYEELWINEGVNFRDKTWNLFGGFNDSLLTKLGKLQSYRGQVFCWGHEVPTYSDLIEKRSNKPIEFDKPIIEIEQIIPSKKLILGDSHSISVYKSGYHIIRNDSKTLHGFLKEGLKSYVKENYNELIFYAGNIDVRFHLLRIGEGYDYGISDMISELAEQIKNLTHVKKVTLTELLPINEDSRKIPKTGQYKGMNFYGSMEDRSIIRRMINNELKEACVANKWNFITWSPEIYDGEWLATHIMEPKQSVHLSPKYYLFNESIPN